MNAKKSRGKKIVSLRALGFGDNKQQMCTSFAAVHVFQWVFGILFYSISFRLALHAIKCVDYKVVAIDLILMLVCARSRSRCLSFALCVWVCASVRFNVYYFANRTFYKLPVPNEKCWNFTWVTAVHCRLSSFNRLLPLLLILYVVAIAPAAAVNVGIVATANECYTQHTATHACNPIHYFIVAAWLSLILSGGFSNCQCICSMCIGFYLWKPYNFRDTCNL